MAYDGILTVVKCVMSQIDVGWSGSSLVFSA